MTRGIWLPFVLKLARNRRDGLRKLGAALRGTCYAAYFRLFRRDVVIELPFLAYERVSITGPGSVRIGRYCSVYPNVFRGLSIVTLSPSAVVRIGERCSLGGLAIRCRDRVVIGERTMTAHSLIQDVLLFSVSPRSGEGNGAVMMSGAIEVGRNAWIGGLACLLPGSSVGDDSVLAWGATCFDAVIPPASLASGNPVTRTLPIARLQKFGRSARDISAARLAL